MHTISDEDVALERGGVRVLQIVLTAPPRLSISVLLTHLFHHRVAQKLCFIVTKFVPWHSHSHSQGNNPSEGFKRDCPAKKNSIELSSKKLYRNSIKL